MRVLLEVVTDERHDAVDLIREAARHLKLRRENSGLEVQYCKGAYRITVIDDDDPTIPPTPGHVPGGNCWKRNTNDVCLLHDEPRGECATCPKCTACAPLTQRG